MSHADLFILECCLLRFGITTVTAEDDEHRGDYFLCEEFRRAVTEFFLQNGDHEDQAQYKSATNGAAEAARPSGCFRYLWCI